MKKKSKYYLFIALLVFLGLIISVGLFVSAGLLYNVFFANGIRDLLFVPQFAILAAVYYLVFPVIMVLISNVYFKASGKKKWGNWLKIPLKYNEVFTVIAVYQCAFVVIEVLVFGNMINATYTIEKIIMLTVPFIMFFLSRDIVKKLFGYAEADGVSETDDEFKIDPNNFTIRQPIYALIIYIIITLMFLGIVGICIWMFFENGKTLDDLLGMFLLFPFVLMGPFFIIIRSRWKIKIKDEKITYTTYFKRTKSCTFDYITRVKQGVGKTRIGTIFSMTAYHENEKLFVVTDHCTGYKEFIQRLKDEGVHIEW